MTNKAKLRWYQYSLRSLGDLEVRKKTRIAVVTLILGSLFVVAYGYYRYHFPLGYQRYLYPFGPYHRCNNQLEMVLREYAEAHGGNFPTGEASPEASLSLIGKDYAYLLVRRDASPKVVEQILGRGELLGPETCGWNYVEGLRLDSNPRLALFWDKEGLSEIGARISGGGHYVSFVRRSAEHVPASRWDDFLEEQRKLLAEEKAKRQHGGQP